MNPVMLRSSRLGRRLRSSQGSAGPLKVCIVGSGPAGFYTAHQLIKRHADTEVDILERLPIPFGLVRFGVAPDHPEVKNCTNQFTTLAKTERCRFIGNVCLGKDITLEQLKPHYHAVVMAYGAEDDRVLGIPGEDLPGVYSARAFVGWYNGLPSHRDLNPDLSGDVAVVVGHGNVALDVARMLLTPVDILKKTDMCQHALEALAESKITRVQVIGRRGPLQVAFTIKEIREMTRLPGCRPCLNPEEFDSIRDLLPSLPRPRKRLTELMIKTADSYTDVSASSPGGSQREWGLSFLRSPVEVLADEESGRVRGIRVEENRLEGDWQAAKAISTGEFEEMKCSMVLRSIGYRTLPVDSNVPFDEKKGIIPNKEGQVLREPGGEQIPGLYCSGWVKTGPVGVIVTTMNNAFETAELIVHDYKQGRLDKVPRNMPDVLETLSSQKAPVLFSDWERIDTEEKRLGEMRGKPREKITSVQRMLELSHKTHESL